MATCVLYRVPDYITRIRRGFRAMSPSAPSPPSAAPSALEVATESDTAVACRAHNKTHGPCTVDYLSIYIASPSYSNMHWGRLWKPQNFGKKRVPPRKPPRRTRDAYSKHAPYIKHSSPSNMTELTSTTTFAAHCACSGLLLLAYTVFIFRRLASFRKRVCLPPDHHSYQLLMAAQGARFASRYS